jgi:phosphocarrier protein
MITKTVKIINKHGLHMRPCMEIIDASANFECDIHMSKDVDNWIDAKSMIHLCMIGAVLGDEVTVRANGSDEESAVAEIIKLIEKGFGETIVEISNEHKNL